MLCTFKAFELTLVAHVIAAKRINIVLSVIIGYYFLGESGIKQRFMGAIIMFIGVSIVTLF